jgi:hypothetical protein
MHNTVPYYPWNVSVVSQTEKPATPLGTLCFGAMEEISDSLALKRPTFLVHCFGASASSVLDAFCCSSQCIQTSAACKRHGTNSHQLALYKKLCSFFLKTRPQKSQEKDKSAKIATDREALFVGQGFEVARTGSVLANRVVIWRGRTRQILHSIIHSNSKAIKI